MALKRVDTYDEIERDLRSVLDAKASLPPSARNSEGLATMFRAALPGLCRRLCELAFHIGPTPGDLSADILICHDNDNGVLRCRIFESFPSYGIDRTIQVRNGWWALHTRDVYYRDETNPSHNCDVVAEAILKRTDVFRPVDLSTSTPSEAAVVQVNSLVPAQLRAVRDLSSIRPGTIVSMSLVYYDSEPHGRSSVITTAARVLTVKSILDELYELSLLQSISVAQLSKVFDRLLKKVDAEEVVGFTLKEAVHLVFGLLEKSIS